MSVVHFPEHPEDAVTTKKLQQFKELLELAPESKEASHKTFFEICDVSNRELSYSRFLEFFLNPRGEHGFGNLFLKSLVSLSKGTVDELDFGDVRIDCEVRTIGAGINKRKRIDVVIQGDTFVIGIENKIGAELNNPLEEYLKHLQDLAKATEPAKKLVPIVLSVQRLKPEQQDECSRVGFEQMLYRDFIHEIQENLGARLPQADNRSITYLLDFITSIHHLQKGTYMDEKLLKFFQDNEGLSLRFHQKTKELVNMMREKVKKVAENVEFPSPFKKGVFWASLTNGDSTDTLIYDVLSSSVKISERLTCYAEAVCFLNKGWMIVLAWEQGESVAALGKWLKDNGIKLNEKSPVPDKRWVYAEFPFVESEESVAKKYQELLFKIAGKLKTESRR
jgi:hypothetical protein